MQAKDDVLWYFTGLPMGEVGAAVPRLLRAGRPRSHAHALAVEVEQGSLDEVGGGRIAQPTIAVSSV